MVVAIILGITTYVLLLLPHTPKANAQTLQLQDIKDQVTFGVSPAIIEMNLVPKKVNTAEILVYNVNPFPLPIKASAKNFYADESIPINARSMYDASSWIKLEPADFIINPGESKKITVTINMPENAEPGGHYGTIFFQPVTPENPTDEGKKTYITSRVGVLIFLTAPGDINERLNLTNVQISNFTSFGPNEMNVTFQNPGNIHIIPTGNVTITNLITGKIIFNEQIPSKIVLPQTEKTEIISLITKKMFPGKYRLNLDLEAGNSKIKIQREIIFWVFPLFPFLLSVLPLTLLIRFIIIKKDRFRKAVAVLFEKDNAQQK